jgi:hypothetical protein
MDLPPEGGRVYQADTCPCRMGFYFEIIGPGMLSRTHRSLNNRGIINVAAGLAQFLLRYFLTQLGI